MGKLFISYRREQGHFVDRLAEALEKRISGTAFVDLTGINEPDFEDVLFREIRACDVFILIVSPETFDPKRINNETDMLRREIACALNPNPNDKGSTSKPIVLVLVEGFTPPEASLLPEDIRKITTKQGIEFYRRFFDAGVEYLARFCQRLVPQAFEHQTALYTSNRGNLERHLKQSVSEAIEQLIRQVLTDLKESKEERSRTISFDPWTIAEGLIAILYSDSSPISAQRSGSLDQSVLATIAIALTGIDEQINGGGIPAYPDIPISDRGVVDATAMVIAGLCSLRLFMYQYGLDTLSTENASVSLLKIDGCINRLCTWLRRNQNDDHGWGLWRGTKSRVTATTWAIFALIEAGIDIEEPFLQRAQNWLVKTQRDDGWWSLTPDTKQADVTSTSFAIMALSKLSNTIMQETIQRAVYALQTNSNWDDAEHRIDLPVGQGYANEFVTVTYASAPRAICALLVGGVSPTSPFILNMFSKILDEVLTSGGWTMKKSKVKRLIIWYTYVVIECIYYWFVYRDQISYLVQLSKVDQALSGVITMYKAKQREVQHLTQELMTIKKINEEG
jgi:TIR domain/Squalene-hopene cyclase N-terminal domain